VRSPAAASKAGNCVGRHTAIKERVLNSPLRAAGKSEAPASCRSAGQDRSAVRNCPTKAEFKVAAIAVNLSAPPRAGLFIAFVNPSR
jgi:hypothetical protein